MLRPLLSIVAGFALWSALWLGGDVLLRRIFPGDYPADFPEVAMSAVAPLAATLVLAVLCSYVSGRLTRKVAGERSGAVAVLAVLLLLVGIAVQSSMWHALPLWYHLPFLALLAPVCLLGGRRTGRIPASS